MLYERNLWVKNKPIVNINTSIIIGSNNTAHGLNTIVIGDIPRNIIYDEMYKGYLIEYYDKGVIHIEEIIK